VRPIFLFSFFFRSPFFLLWTLLCNSPPNHLTGTKVICFWLRLLGCTNGRWPHSYDGLGDSSHNPFFPRLGPGYLRPRLGPFISFSHCWFASHPVKRTNLAFWLSGFFLFYSACADPLSPQGDHAPKALSGLSPHLCYLCLIRIFSLWCSRHNFWCCGAPWRWGTPSHNFSFCFPFSSCGVVLLGSSVLAGG